MFLIHLSSLELVRLLETLMYVAFPLSKFVMDRNVLRKRGLRLFHLPESPAPLCKPRIPLQDALKPLLSWAVISAVNGPSSVRKGYRIALYRILKARPWKGCSVMVEICNSVEISISFLSGKMGWPFVLSQIATLRYNTSLHSEEPCLWHALRYSNRPRREGPFPR